MGRVPYEEFVGSRVRMQRLKDQAILPGWLESLKNHTVRVLSETSIPVQSSERFLFQVQGPSADAYFIAQCSGLPPVRTQYVHGSTALQAVDIEGLSYQFEVLSHIQLKDIQQQNRKLMHAMSANLETCGHTTEVLISDAGSNGMGVLSWEELQEGDVVEISVKSKDIDARFLCQVRHCRPETRLTGAYRVGLQFHNPDRLAINAWRKLVNPL